MTDPRSDWLRPLADRLIRRRNVLLVGGIVATLLALYPASLLTLDQSLESLYAKDDPHLLSYLESKDLFGGDEFVIVAYQDPQLLEPEGLERVRRISKRLSDIAGVRSESTQNLADAIAPKKLHFLERLLLATRSREMRRLTESVLVGGDNQTTGIVLRLVPETQAIVLRRVTISEIRRVAEEIVPEQVGKNARAYVVGEPVQVHDMFSIVEADGQKLFYWSLVLLAGVIIVLFRSIRWVLLPMAVVAASIIWTEAVLYLSGMQLSMVSSMLNSLVTVIGIAEVMHVTLHYREKRRNLPRVEAMRRTLADLMPITFWTVVTTAAGFTSLLSSQIQPVNSFGTMMSIGSMMVLLAVGVLLPGGVLVGHVQIDPGTAPAEDHLTRFLGDFTVWVQQRPMLAGLATALIAGFTALGFMRLDVETDFSRNFRESSPIVSSLNFVEGNLGGAGTWEVNFPAPEVLTPQFLAKVRDLAERFREMEQDGQPRLTKVLAITDILDLVPGATDTPERIRNKLSRIAEFQPEYEPGLYNAQARMMRFVLRARERQPSETKLSLIEDVEHMANDEFGEAKTTGMFVLLTFLIESLLRDQFISFLLTTIGIWAMMTIAFRSWRVGLVSLAPNVFPIVVLIGGMGWLGLPINIGTAMIASVSMGLTIDSSIHYIAGYRRARQDLQGGDALRRTHEDVGRALVFTTFALMVGFSVLTLSNFIPLVYFGVLVSAAMLGGLIGNLTFFPLLLQWADRFEGKSEARNPMGEIRSTKSE
ncbi:MAG: MMPL family transporter [Planctomycetaceae bacterium]